MYGRTGDLLKLNHDRNDLSLSQFERQEANKAYRVIARQMKDKKLMSMRWRLIKAAQAEDLALQDKIAQQMKAYTKEDRETGL